VNEQGSTFEKQNVSQKVKPQHKTPAVTGLIPHSKIVLKGEGHMAFLEAELICRDVANEDVPKKITGRKDLLKALEIERLMENGVPQQEAQEIGKKHFKKQSTAVLSIVE